MVRLTGPSGDETARIQNALNLHPEVALGPGIWSSGPLQVPAGRTWAIEAGAKLRADASLFSLAGLGVYVPFVRVRAVSGVRITGEGTVEVPYDPAYHGQWRACVGLASSTDCRLDGGLTLTSRGGDGVLVSAGRFVLPVVNDPCRDIELSGITCDGCYRDGVALVHVDGMDVLGCTLKNAVGVGAQGGVAIEPDLAAQYFRGVVVDGCTIAGNRGYGFEVQLAKRPQTSDVTLRDSTVEGGIRPAFSVIDRPTAGQTATVTVDGCTLKANYWPSVFVSNLSGADVTLRDSTLLRLRNKPPRRQDIYLYWDRPDSASLLSAVGFENVTCPYKDFGIRFANPAGDPNLPLPGVSGYVWQTHRKEAAAKFGGSGLWLLRPGRDGVPGVIDTPSGSIGCTVKKVGEV